MIGKKAFWARLAAVVAALVLTAFAGLAPGRAADLDPAKMSVDAIKALEQRLTDAGCYKGVIDGAASSALGAAIKACPDQRPFLRIETGMHTSAIRRIGVDTACSLLATASDDKTVRLWSLPDGKLQRVLRLPIGDGEAGKVYATELSPDGRLLAIASEGGYFSDDHPTTLYLYRIETPGELRFLRRTMFGSRIDTLAFDGGGNRVQRSRSGGLCPRGPRHSRGRS